MAALRSMSRRSTQLSLTFIRQLETPSIVPVSAVQAEKGKAATKEDLVEIIRPVSTI